MLQLYPVATDQTCATLAHNFLGLRSAFDLTGMGRYRYIKDGGGVMVGLPMHRPEVIRCFNLNSAATMALWHCYAALALSTVSS